MKYKIMLLVLACALVMSSCNKVDEKAITGDVKDTQSEVFEVDQVQQEEKDEKIELPEEIVIKPEEEIAQKLGAIIVSDKGEFFDDANSFLYSLMDKDYATISSYTGGQEDAYSFLDTVDIIDFELYPLQFTEERISSLENDGIYPAFEVGYLANLLVKSSDSDAFKSDDNFYFLGFTSGNPMGYELCAFVPYNKTEIYAFTDVNGNEASSFIREFISLYGENLTAGRNYPDSFDFSRSSHLITHLMAENGYGFPPYSLDMINGFLAEAFESAKPLDYIDLLSDEWLYPVYSDIVDDEMIYGCSYAHGGYIVEHTVVFCEKDGNDATYEVEVFADYAKFAKAYDLRINMSFQDGKPPMLTMVSKNNVTGANPCAVSL